MQPTKSNLIQRVLKPVMLLHFSIWVVANIFAFTFYGRLFRSRAADIGIFIFGVISIGCIVTYWLKGLVGLYGLLVTYIALTLAVMILAASDLGVPVTGMHWLFAAVLLVFPVFEVYSLIVEEKS